MKSSFKTLLFILLFLSAGSLQAQIFKNNGAPITIRSGSKVIINGNVQNAKGTISIQGSGELQVYGNLTVSADTVRFENLSLGMVTGNMSIESLGVFYRNTGSLSVFGVIFNNGMLYNLGGTIEIGTP